MSLLRVARSAVARPMQAVAALWQPVRHMGGGGGAGGLNLTRVQEYKEGEIPVGSHPGMLGRQLFEAELRAPAQPELNLDAVAGFNDRPAVGPFGTVAAPVRIYSSFHSRYVGCKGGDDSKHRILWFELKQGPKHVCTECGQVFQLVTPHEEHKH